MALDTAFLRNHMSTCEMSGDCNAGNNGRGNTPPSGDSHHEWSPANTIPRISVEFIEMTASFPVASMPRLCGIAMRQTQLSAHYFSRTMIDTMSAATYPYPDKNHRNRKHTRCHLFPPEPGAELEHENVGQSCHTECQRSSDRQKIHAKQRPNHYRDRAAGCEANPSHPSNAAIGAAADKVPGNRGESHQNAGGYKDATQTHSRTGRQSAGGLCGLFCLARTFEAETPKQRLALGIVDQDDHFDGSPADFA